MPVNVSRGQEACIPAERKDFLNIVVNVLKALDYPAHQHFVPDKNDPRRKYGRLYLCPKGTKRPEDVYDLPVAMDLNEVLDE